MDDEEGFLRRIAEEPDDRATRRVYADWLEERGDSRSELIRVEEGMRSTPIATDEYWALKARREALRAILDADWVAALGRGARYEPVFREVPGDVRGRWRLIREFVDRWYGFPMGDAGVVRDEVRAIEKRLGRRLPPSVREWVGFVADLERGEHLHILRDDLDLGWVEEIAAFSLLIQGEGDYHWAVLPGDEGREDPPVTGFHLDYESDDREAWVADGPVAASVSGFALDHLASYLSAPRGGWHCTNWMGHDALEPRIEAARPLVSTFEGLTVAEGTDWIVFILPGSTVNPNSALQVLVRTRVAARTLPKPVLDLARLAGARAELFRDETPDPQGVSIP